MALAQLCFFSCAKKSDRAVGALKITATFYPIYVMCLNIADGIDGVELSVLAPQGAGCLHDFQMTSRDMAAISSCDILVANGAGLESFIGKAIELKGEAVVVASDGFPLLDENPHVWVSVDGARHETMRIAQGLSRLDKTRASRYMENAERYDARLSSLLSEMRGQLREFKGRSIVTFHEAFPYFADEFSLNIVSVIEREPGTAPSARELSQTIEKINALRAQGEVPALFAEPQYSSSSARVIAAETGLDVGVLDPCVEGEMSKDAYIDAQRKNAAALARALSAR